MSRPDLLVAGESLGSFGGAEAFDDLVGSTRASLWVGPPEFMHLRREAEAVRVAGSPQIRPQVDDGEDVAFVNRRSDLDGTRPRAVFLQQADDPIVWWDLPTFYRRPDWLEEPRDPAVNPAMSWRPAATFLNLTVDMVVGNDFDEDHGHLTAPSPSTPGRRCCTRTAGGRPRWTSCAGGSSYWGAEPVALVWPTGPDRGTGQPPRGTVV